MKIYLVGGAVRDKLLGLQPKERDWVVVGATASDMLRLGYRQVGKEFPVFLHPQTNEEYALARMERKVDLGYKGFTFDTSPSVTLEDDLIRRDLTINAMAETLEGDIIDPYHGREDLAARILRHVSPAFAEDPVRILRIGRFLARYADLEFDIAPKTLALMQQMVDQGEVNALVAERVWKELERALGENHPEKFFAVLTACHALPILFPPLTNDTFGLTALVAATALTPDVSVRFAALLHAIDTKQITAICHRYRIPNAYRQLALLTATHYQTIFHAPKLEADALLKLFAALDIYRRYDRFQHIVASCGAIANAYQFAFDANWLLASAAAVKAVPIQPLLSAGYTGQTLAIKLQEARQAALIAFIKTS